VAALLPPQAAKRMDAAMSRLEIVKNFLVMFLLRKDSVE
jgi:hypothetical protein